MYCYHGSEWLCIATMTVSGCVLLPWQWVVVYNCYHGSEWLYIAAMAVSGSVLLLQWQQVVVYCYHDSVCLGIVLLQHLAVNRCVLLQWQWMVLYCYNDSDWFCIANDSEWFYIATKTVSGCSLLQRQWVVTLLPWQRMVVWYHHCAQWVVV